MTHYQAMVFFWFVIGVFAALPALVLYNDLRTR